MRLGGARAPARGALALRLWGSRRGCRTSTTSTRPHHFVPRAIAMFGQQPEPRTTSPTRPPSPICCTACSRVWFGGGAGVNTPTRRTPPRSACSRASTVGGARHARGLAALPRRRAALRPPRRAARGAAGWRSRSCRSSTRSRAQRRARARAADAVAVGQRRRAARRAPRDYADRRPRARAGAATKYTGGIVVCR